MHNSIPKEHVMAHGEMIDGVWHTRFHNTKATGGRFKRTEPKFRNWVTPDAARERAARTDFRRRAGAIISMSRSPAHGRTARSSFASSNGSKT